ncbi:MAG: hypothetical protein AAGC88_06270 [Bacteroidota bacterium]
MKYLGFLLSLVISVSCSHFGKEDPRDLAVPVDSTLFHPGKVLAEIIDPRLEEVSGMVVSRDQSGLLWVHNDSGDSAKLYLINFKGEVQMTVKLEGIKAVDWEDMSLVPTDSTDQLIIGDIGDNQGRRDKIYVHVIDEPIYNGAKTANISPSDITTYTLQYHQGPRDAESIGYHPLSKEVNIITKREENVMFCSFRLGDNRRLELSQKGKIGLRNFTATDINANGEVLIKNYNNVFYWDNVDKLDQLDIEDAVRIPYIVEPQGEAIAWDEKGGFYTLSEFNEDSKQLLYYYAPKLAIGI